MLWECTECGATTETRTRVCGECGTVTRYVRAESEDDPGHEVGSLRDYWLTRGKELNRAATLS